MTAELDTEKGAVKEHSTEGTQGSEVTLPPKSDGLDTTSEEPEADTVKEETVEDDFRPGLRLYIIIVGLGITLLLTALENTVVTVAAPVILTDLKMGNTYIWITNAFFLCSAAFQPLIGQMCNVFGRRWLTLVSIAFFTFGSGICGGASNGGMLIAGRAIQGIGSGGIMLLNDIIVSDLVPLRQRGNYVGIILSIYGVGTTLGPFIGGAIVAYTSWRWVFYMNLPIGGTSLVLMFIFLQVHYNRDLTFRQRMERIDFVGNVVLMASSVAILYALAQAGSIYSWGRTSVILGINTFINSGLTYWVVFFLPVFFQAVKLYSPMGAGVALLPQSLAAIPGAAGAAAAISRWGRYKPVHVAGFAIFILGLGLFSRQDESTNRAQWALYQSVCALGAGVLLNSQLPAFQAFVPERDQAAATATWCFIRSIGFVWGVAIPPTVFNSRVDDLIDLVSDPAVRKMLAHGGALHSTATTHSSHCT